MMGSCLAGASTVSRTRRRAETIQKTNHAAHSVAEIFMRSAFPREEKAPAEARAWILIGSTKTTSSQFPLSQRLPWQRLISRICGGNARRGQQYRAASAYP